MRVCLLAHGRCCTNASELPWAAFYSSRKEESNTAFFYADSRVPCAFQAPGNKQWKNPYSIFYTRTTHVFGENPGYFLAHTVASQVWVLAEVSQRDVFRILIWNSCWWGIGMRSYDLCLDAPVGSGWTALNPQRSRDQRDQAAEQEVFSWEGFLSSEPVIFYLSLPVLLATVFILEFPLAPSPWPPAASHTTLWPGRLMSFTLSSPAWQPV